MAPLHLDRRFTASALLGLGLTAWAGVAIAQGYHPLAQGGQVPYPQGKTYAPAPAQYPPGG